MSSWNGAGKANNVFFRLVEFFASSVFPRRITNYSPGLSPSITPFHYLASFPTHPLFTLRHPENFFTILPAW